MDKKDFKNNKRTDDGSDSHIDCTVSDDHGSGE